MVNIEKPLKIRFYKNSHFHHVRISRSIDIAVRLVHIFSIFTNA